MPPKKKGLLVAFMAAMVVSASWAFNIDAANPEIYRPTGENEDFFGYKVLQFISGTERGVIVSAPLQQNGSGGICKCVQNQSCYCSTPPAVFPPTEEGSLKHIGLSMAHDSTNPPKFITCGPGLAHKCQNNTYLNSVCYEFNSQVQVTSNFTPAFQECTNKKVDLVFLFDGSESMTFAEFEKNKVFILEMMNTLISPDSSIQFAAVQFSTSVRTVFDFDDYRQGRAKDKLMKEAHMKKLTNTYKAIDFVLKFMFDNSSAGASPDATKVLVIITDGNPSESDKRIQSIKRSEEKHIKRFVIGVKKVDLDKLESMASDPKKKYVFKIENYDGLSGILDNFQNRIFAIEGTNGTDRAEIWTKEMSQSGFSALYEEDILVLGAVGSNNWRGSLYETRGSGSEEQEMQDPTLERESYMGYSLAIAKKNDSLLYLTGAPRSEHTGKVILFRIVEKNWTVTQRLSGEQIGSYFGAELCSVDVDSDNTTDFLLVGAPMFHGSQSEGRIYVYTVTDELELKLEQKLELKIKTSLPGGPSRGRFGSSISSLADLNGDGLRDLAVGSPLEDGGRGAVYIYLGHKITGTREHYSQRLAAKTLSSQLQLFGQALDGRLDLGEDGLSDIAVGAHGAVVILRSRPVLNVSTHLSFDPPEINADQFDCLVSSPIIFPVVNLTVCFSLAEATKSKDGALAAGTSISYTLDADDPLRQISRAFFDETDQTARRLNKEVTLRQDQNCFNHAVYMMQCVRDTFSCIKIKLNFSQIVNQKKTPSAILNADDPTHTEIEVPFSKNCRHNATCVAELEVDFDFTTRTGTLVVPVDPSSFNVTVRLSNRADDSYNTSLTLRYSPGLSFSMMKFEKDKSTRATPHRCGDLKGVMDRTVCSISLPVYRSQTTATFHVRFSMNASYDWNDTMSMTITGQSDNDNSTNSSMTKTIDVQFEVDLRVMPLDEKSITYINFTQEDKGPKKLVNIYEVKNLALKAVPLTVDFIFPTVLEHQFKMNNENVSFFQNHTECEPGLDVIPNVIPDVISNYCTPEKQCKSIRCKTLLKKYSTVTFTLLGDVAFRGLEQFVQDMPLLTKYTGAGADITMKSFVQLSYDNRRYVQKSSKHGQSFHKAQIEVRAEFIIQPNNMLIIGSGVGGGLLLLVIITVGMFKMGCFKSKRIHPDMEENSEEQQCENADAQAGPGGTEAGPDGTEDGPDGIEAGPDGTEDGPDGTEAGPDGTEAGPDGTEAGPDGTEAGPDGTAETKAMLELDNGQNANNSD